MVKQLRRHLLEQIVVLVELHTAVAFDVHVSLSCLRLWLLGHSPSRVFRSCVGNSIATCLVIRGRLGHLDEVFVGLVVLVVLVWTVGLHHRVGLGFPSGVPFPFTCTTFGHFVRFVRFVPLNRLVLSLLTIPIVSSISRISLLTSTSTSPSFPAPVPILPFPFPFPT